MKRIKIKFDKFRNTPSDINEHLETLARYARECDHITELGVRTGLSTYALLYGKPVNAKMISYDIAMNSDVGELIQLTRDAKINWNFVLGDTREITIESTDMLFIDTLHNYDLLKIELERHATKVKKYLIFHDTTTFGERGETEGHEGLVKAIKEYQISHPNWVTKEIFTNNNGLTVLERITDEELSKREKESRKVVYTKSKVVVFTAIYGGIDTLKKQPEQNVPVNWICFTDDPNIECEEGAREQREIRVIAPHKHLHPRMQAKYFRTHPYDFLDYETIMYMDGSARLLREDSVSNFIRQYLDKSDILTFQHPDRNCVVDEAELCTNIEKYKGLPMMQQVKRYTDQGFPRNYGLTGTGLLIHKRDNRNVRDFLHKRWTECLERTYQDQLSFDPLVYFEKIKRQRVQENERHNDYISFNNPHKHKS